MLMLENPIRSDTRGTEEIGPEDTFDADYGQLLQRVYKKGWYARQDSNLRPSA